MATTEVFYNGDGQDLTFTIPFEYLEESDVKVSVGGVLKTQDTDYTFSTLTEITFTVAPPVGTDNVRIFRDTDIESLRNEFFAGSAIRAQDLNDDFLQTLYTVQEIEDQYVTKTNGEFDTNIDLNSNRITNVADPVDQQDAVTKQYLEDNYFDDDTETITSAETWVSNDGSIATTAAIEARFFNDTTETIQSGETWPNDDNTIATTAAIDDAIDAAITGDISGSDGVSIANNGNGTITVGLTAGAVDLDRIKAADIDTSSDGWSNNDTTIATTAKIDDIIDLAITGDILVDNTGLTKSTSNGQTTLGIGVGSVDLNRIKADDIITLAEQNSNSGPTVDDDSIFTSSAAAKRFDTIVQTSEPSGTDWEVGKTWLQNDDDLTLKVWNGSAWTSVASGGAFREQTKVIYVDKSGGDDAQTGHRISAPKLTIKEAINDINADIDTSIKTAGSGYVEGTYNGVALTGGTTGSGLTADIVVNASGAVSTVTINSAATLQEYQIGDILTTSNANLGGSGSGFELEVTGEGDGTIVVVAAGTYQEIAPIQIKRRNVSIIGQALRSCVVHPTVATQGDHADGNHALFELNSGSFIQNLTLTGMQAGAYNAGDPNTLDSDLPKRQGWNFKFYDNAFISKSPYIQNCTNFSDSEIDNSDLRTHRPRGGTAGDTDSAPTGGGMLVNGSAVRTSSPLRSMVADSYTHVGLNGPGILVTNNGYIQATSSYAFFNKYHIKTLNGGQANLAASTTDFGEKALVADGKSTSPIFTAAVNNVGGYADGDITFNVDTLLADASWHGSTERPATNMLVEVNSVIYPILSATAVTGGYAVTISRPDPTDRSINLGLNGAIADDAVVNFYLRSQIASSGHTMEYVGSGMDYSALPENGGVPDETKQITELNNGKVWTAITDHNGKFKIGGNQTDDPFFTVDQQLGFVTIPEGSIAFNLLSDTTPQLGGDLDTNDFKITSAGNNNVHIGPHGTGKIRVDAAIITASDNNLTLDPHGTGQVDVSTHKILNVVDPTDAQDAATKNYVDNAVSGFSTNSISQGNSNVTVTDDNVAAGNVKINVDNVEVAEFLTNGINLKKGVGVVGNIGTVDGGNIYITDANNNYISFSTPATLSNATTDFILPDGDGSTGQFLKTDGSGNLSWSSVSTDSISNDNSSVTVVDNGISNGSVEIRTDNVLQAKFGSGASNFSSHVELANQKEVRYYETTANGTNYLGFKAPASVTADVTFTLPDGDGTANQVLTTNGSGTLAWADQSGGGGATGGGSDTIFQENKLIVTTDYTIGTNIGGSASIGTGASCVGPITVNSGITLTVPANARLVVL